MKTCIIVFGREPIRGEVKRRLAAEIGEDATLAIYRALLEHALREALASGMPVALALAEPRRSDWEPPPGIDLTQQRSGGLGERMEGAFDERFGAGFEAALLFGTDIPGCDRGFLGRAAVALGDRPVVLGPARDGGYYLVGQRRPGVAMFDDVPWSSPDTLAATRRRLERLGVHHRELGLLDDIDTLADLRRSRVAGTIPAELRRVVETACSTEESR